MASSRENPPTAKSYDPPRFDATGAGGGARASAIGVMVPEARNLVRSRAARRECLRDQIGGLVAYVRHFCKK